MYYAIRNGRAPGIYKSWDEAKRQVIGFPHAIYKKFKSEEEASAFLSPPKETHGTETVGYLNCFTDGSCFDNGKPNAFGGYAVVWPEHPEYDFAASVPPPTTNNICEYLAVLKAFEIADQIDGERKQVLVVHTDSELLYKTVTLWMSTWKQNNWKKRGKQEVANLELVKQLDEALIGRSNTIVKWVRAHESDSSYESTCNGKVDRMAMLAALNASNSCSKR
jgi:ribonuclease HI